jgi:hypothetical protein
MQLNLYLMMAWVKSMSRSRIVLFENLVDGEDSLMEGVIWQNELKLSANYGAEKKEND